ncbi:class I SAM-dependent methyltransferase [Ammoniphilus resinae]|uniref:Ubiquinone/menaquinone biosynthesis C-methylase UbiE n=1 Tax=Ammoniphilus resinae TaxID=861532 RepID=A0ABS4GXZ5_9BACL|nr:class I SAM-dependent methyltransferase [Ammoniphilus resinae]MBP1934912.1 ubiquinone/menaquinone biosynthesis C-methylase UbiE [Ammoniphilus resinae]
MEFHKDLSNVGWEKVKRRQLQRESLVYEWIELVGMKQGSSVLDIGTGPGVFTLKYSRAVGNKGEIYALDQSKEALDLFLKDIDGNNKNIKPIYTNAEGSLDPVGKVDIVMITDVLHHADSPVDIIRNVYQHINGNGCALIAEFDPESEGHIGPPLKNRISKEEMKELVQTVGFQIVKEGKQEYEHYYMLLKK